MYEQGLAVWRELEQAERMIVLSVIRTANWGHIIYTWTTAQTGTQVYN